MKNRLLLIATLFLLTLSQLSAQQYTYVYDAAGNRTKVTLLKSSVATTPEQSKEAVVVTDEGREFKLYPNPTQGLVTIECPGLEDGTKVTCTIHDASGRFISNAVYTGQQTLKCDLSNVPNGLYVFHVKLKDSQHILKVLKN